MESPVLGILGNQEEIWSLCSRGCRAGTAWSGEEQADRRQRSALISSSVKNSEGERGSISDKEIKSSRRDILFQSCSECSGRRHRRVYN